MEASISIDGLIKIIRRGGAVKTGVDVYNARRVLLIEKNVLIRGINALLTLKQNGLLEVPIDYSGEGGVWDKNGKLLESRDLKESKEIEKKSVPAELGKKLKEIAHLRKESEALHQFAKENVKKVIKEIERTGGEFELEIVVNTIDEILIFLANKENAFSYLAREIFSYDDYLINHSVNVCTLGTAVLQHFNDQFGALINNHLCQIVMDDSDLDQPESSTSYIAYYPEELKEISMGFFLHDIGKILVPEHILNKQGNLTEEEFELVKTHSYELGPKLLSKNITYNSFMENILKYHHAALYEGEERSYPTERLPIEIPPYVKVCKLVDIYDAMTSKRCYRDALSPIKVVTDIFRKYADKGDILLKIILKAFLKIVGVYPPGSVIRLQNGQLAYVLDSEGPILIPFTDRQGNTLSRAQDPIDLSSVDAEHIGLGIDRRTPPLSPKDTYDSLPAYLKESQPDF